MKCPICNEVSSDTLATLPCGGLDNSYLYSSAIIDSCARCGHVYNSLTKTEKKNLHKYYDNEFPSNTISSIEKVGALPGSSNENNIFRYAALYGFLEKWLNPSFKILDVGCAIGGFLKFMHEKGFGNLYGIDSSIEYVEQTRGFPWINVSQGSAENIPFESNSMDCIVTDNVAEHIFDPNSIFVEARRVLKPNGIYCVCVPNAMMYDNRNFSDFYWFILREHIQHYDKTHLELIARKNGFDVIDCLVTVTKMSDDKINVPVLTMLFTPSESKCFDVSINNEIFDLRRNITEYISCCYRELHNKQKLINKFLMNHIPLYCYGISKEFFYLYNNTNLNKCNIQGFIDDTIFKQEYFTFNNRKIQDSKILENSNSSAVLITAMVFAEKLVQNLRELNYKGEIIRL